MSDKTMGRPRIYERRVDLHIALPEKAAQKIDKMRGRTPTSQFLGQIVCEALGIGGINAS